MGSMNLFVQKVMLTVFSLAVELPALVKALTMLLFDRNFNTRFFNNNMAVMPLCFSICFDLFYHP